MRTNHRSHPHSSGRMTQSWDDHEVAQNYNEQIKSQICGPKMDFITNGTETKDKITSITEHKNKLQMDQRCQLKVIKLCKH